MSQLICIMTLFFMQYNQVIYDFSKKSNIEDWRIVDDVVMGGRSSGSMGLNVDGFGVFEGEVSLENNGGFSSVRYRFQKILVKKYSRIAIKLKGDRKKYQFRIKANSGDYYSFTSTFETSGEWQGSPRWFAAE